MTTFPSADRTSPVAAEADVIVIGGGPVGLTLAHELGSRGVGVVLVEPRTEPDTSSPRCKQVNPRSMEHFRRLGLADAVRAASGLPFGWSDSAVFCTSLTGSQIERFDGVFALSDVPRSEFPEPAQWTAQYRIEAALRAALPARDTVSALWGSRLVDVQQDAASVVVTIEDADGHTSRIRGSYLAAADGGRSTVRRALDIGLGGRSSAMENLQVVFEAPGLGERHPQGRAVQYWVLNPEASGLLGRLDTADTWWGIVMGAPLDASPAWTEQALRTMVGAEVPLRVRSQDPWTARMLIADRYREGRCFLAGDAAHLNPPWGGFGANTGIGDAVDLGWKLAAAVSGWAGEELLDSYEADRRPVAAATIAEAERNMAVLTPELSRPDLDGDGPSAAAARAAAAEAIRRAKTSETYTLGFVLGTGCPQSPLVVPDDRPAPQSETSVYRPSAAPGMRLPHLWLGPGCSLYDRLGPGFTLLEVGSAPAPDAWRSAADERGMPLHTLRLNRPDAHTLFGARYLLVRPDHLVAWRGDDLPADPGPLLDHVRGGGGRGSHPVAVSAVSGS
ncbi:FAD-dependent oxidoreductase [Geodermatophilus sp. CPCC 206100]|uniref:FAD-dependent oxidoreductase n=1 Tax=Geodermatophilus sp. CPCC 206100 TaxID=3020054 RepID=UPI003B00686B